MSEVELLPCPFCGAKAYSQKLSFQPTTKYFRCGLEAPDRSIIAGTGCGAIISFVGEQGNVPAEKFNRRTTDARIAELEAKLARVRDIAEAKRDYGDETRYVGLAILEALEDE